MTVIDSWSKVEEIIRYLNCMEVDTKKKVVMQQLSAMAPREVGVKLYSPEMIIRAFEYFSMSRCLYHKLRDDFQLPSISTLTRITSKISNIDESAFLSTVFNTLDVKQRTCIILQDEIYVKKMMLYHGGKVFGRSADDPTSLAKTVLGIMLTCLNGGPKFLSKLIPISKLNSEFLHEQIEFTRKAVVSIPSDVKAIVCDGNRINQAFFKLYPTISSKPWITKDGLHLLFDYVHLLKNIRNLWLTEKMGELEFYDKGVKRVAKWTYLKQLHQLESQSLVTLSDLNEVAVAPKPVERQRVSTCLRVFSEKTHGALLTHPNLCHESGDTAIFINKVLTWWKILNVKSLGSDIRHNNSLCAPISSPDDPRLDIILEFGDMALEMGGPQGKRVKQLSRDTACAIHHTCNGLVSLCRHLLETSHSYVLLGQFSTDPLEKEFGKLRQGSGGTYFISVQQCIEKLHIKHSSLLLRQNANIESIDVPAGHHCSSCNYQLSEDAAEVFDNLETLEFSLSDEVKMSLIYIAGYVTRKDTEICDSDLLNCTTFYFQKYGKYTDSIDRGGLNIPLDHACQWSIFCFVLFYTVKENVCRNSLKRLFMLVSEFYLFGMEERHATTLSNIFLNSFANISLQDLERSQP